MSEIVSTTATSPVVSIITALTRMTSGISETVQSSMDKLEERDSELQRICRKWLEEKKQVQQLNTNSNSEMKALFGKNKKELSKLLSSVKERTLKTPLVNQMALESSGYLQFASETNTHALKENPASRKVLNKLMNDAAGEFRKKQLRYVYDAFSESVKELGFQTVVASKNETGKTLVSFANNNGQAVILNAASSDHGAKMKIDFTGFRDDSCEKTRQKLWLKLRERKVFLKTDSRLFHKNPAGTQNKSAAPEGIQGSIDQELKRRQSVMQENQTLKN